MAFFPSFRAQRLPFFAASIAGIALIPVMSLLFGAIQGWDERVLEHLLHLLHFVIPHALFQTSLLLAGVALVAGMMGVVSAWIITMYRFWGRQIVMWMLPLPLAIPTYITAYCYVELLEPLGPVQTALRHLFGWSSPAEYVFPQVRSLSGAILIMGSVVYPYVYLSARVMFASQSANVLEAARVMGASPWYTFRWVALPLARPALAVGISLALLEVLNDVGASEYLGLNTLTLILMNTWLNAGQFTVAACISLGMLGLVLVLMQLENNSRLEKRFHTSVRNARGPNPLSLNAKWQSIALLICALPPMLGFVIPVGFLLKTVVERRLIQNLDAHFMSAASYTFGYALITTLILMVLGCVMALSLRARPSSGGRVALRITALGYAMPGVILALGLMLPLAQIGNVLSLGATFLGFHATGPFVIGTGAALIIVYVIRFLSLATQGISASFDRLSPHLDMAARTLGATYSQMVWSIHRPLMGTALASSALLIFVDCLKELPATLLLRPLNVETLATQLYTMASQGQFENGALQALTLVFFGLLPVIGLTHFTKTR
jgi:iron(III) transport system permease protein